LALAEAFAGWVDADRDWELLAPVPFSTVCFRWRPAGRDLDDAALDDANAAIMDAVNRSGEAFLSHTRLGGRFTIRVSIGNLRTEPRHVSPDNQGMNDGRRYWECAVGFGPVYHHISGFQTKIECTLTARQWFIAYGISPDSPGGWF
jgi:glutamate/tyrosine decarboxylase-like PLP-dependent enzyme